MPQNEPSNIWTRRDFLAAATTATAAAALAGCSQTTPSSAPSATAAADSVAPVPQYAAFDLALHSSEKLDNPFWDLVAEARFTAPSGRRFRVEGFYDGQQTWRVRFAPPELGEWKYEATLRAPDSRRHDALSGHFLCQGTQGHGFLRQAKNNPFRLDYADGTPFYPLAVQTSNFLKPDCDGPNPDGTPRFVSNEEWMKQFAGAVNLVRTQLGQGNRDGCAMPLIAHDSPIDQYNLNVAQKMDAIFRAQRAAGLSQILILFQDMSLWGDGKGKNAFGPMRGDNTYKRLDAPNLPQQEKYVRYAVARWAAFIDIWEIFNEDSYAHADYLAHLAKVIRNADPYRHFITTNYAHPEQNWCEIVTFHEYMGIPDNDVDSVLAQRFGMFKAHGKIVQNTEFGNEWGMHNVDPIKWRIAAWTSYMYECGLLFWSMSQFKLEGERVARRGNANAYLGPDSRQHFRVLNDFNKDLPNDMRPTSVGYTDNRNLRLYGLTNGKHSALYVHHFSDHDTDFIQKGQIGIWTGPGRFRMRWINPEDGAEIKTVELDNPQDYLMFDLPPVRIDLACRIDRLT